MKKYYKPIQNHFDPNFIGAILEWRGKNDGVMIYYYRTTEREERTIPDVKEKERRIKAAGVVFEITAAEAALLFGQI